MMDKTFNPKYNLIGDTLGFNQDLIKDEPMLYGASVEFSEKNGGVITQRVLREILSSQSFKEDLPKQAMMGYHPVIDTKVHMLMPGWYPNIPGWHCDGVIRNDQTSQPNLDTLDQDVYHYIFIADVNTEAGTELVIQPLSLNVDTSAVWKSVDREVERCSPTTLTVQNRVLRFNRSAIHRYLPAKNRGWRFFMRLSFYHMPTMNEIRKQTQVYTDINQGW